MKKISFVSIVILIFLTAGCSAAQAVTEQAVPVETATPESAAESETDQTLKKESEVAMISESRISVRIEAIKGAPAGTVLEQDLLDGIELKQLFYKEQISDLLFERIYGKSYKEDCTVPREELVYLRMLHWGFDDQSHVGEMIVNQEIAADVLEIFRQLYEAEYPIEKMRLIDDYDAQDENSMADNNTCAFNFRTISHSDQLSNHSYGRAIDINPLYNPYVKMVNGSQSCEPANAQEYIDRSKSFSYKITETDLCFQLFRQYGFSWGGEWDNSKDYQHFEK